MSVHQKLLALLSVSCPLLFAGCATVTCGPRYIAVLERDPSGQVARKVWLQQCERFTPRIPASSYEYSVGIFAEVPSEKGVARTGGWLPWGDQQCKGWPFLEEDLEARADADRHVWFVAREFLGMSKVAIVATLDLNTGHRTGPFDPAPAWASPDAGDVLEPLTNEMETAKGG